MMNTKLLVLLITLFLLPTTLNAKQIQIGVRAYYPPFEMIIDQKKQVSGFEVDLLIEICKRLQMDCSFVPLDFADLFKAIQSKKISLALGAIIITEDRQQAFLFSLPYLASNAQFITLQKNKFNTISNICNKKIGIVLGSLYKLIALQQCQGAAKIIEYPQISDAYKALGNANVDSIITDQEGAKYWIANNGNLFRLVGNPIPIEMGYAVMANHNDHELINAINSTLLTMQHDGTYLKIYKLYFNQ